MTADAATGGALNDQPRSRRALYGLLAANTVSLSGTRLSMIALPWFVITTTGSAAQTGLVAAAQMAPYVVAKAMAGPIVDRLGSRRVVVTAEIAAGAVVAGLPVLYMLDLLHLEVLLVMVALLGMASGPADGAKAALIPIVADQAMVPLERVTGLYGSIERFATTIGAAAAGGLVALVGPIPALWVTAATFTGAALVIAATAPRPARREREPYFAQLREGLAFIGRDRLLRSLYAMVTATNLLDAAAFSVLLPVWAHQTGYGPEVIGLLAAVLSGAAIGSSVLAAAIGHRMPRRLTYLVGFMVAGLPRFMILALDVPLPLIAAVFAISGLGSGFLNPILGAVIFERIPRGMVGRVSSMGSSLAWAGIPFGGLVGGGLVAAAGLAPALIICGLAYFIVTTLPGVQPEWREMERRPTSGGSRGSAPEERAEVA
jgi:MFS family permease